MNNRILALLFVCIRTLAGSAQDNDNKLFIYPLETAPSLSASFAELRNGHFHSGIDLKTEGVTGKEVYAAGEGYIYRISISPTGFGRALYIRHPSGYSTVYGHLDRFRPDIETFITNWQYQNKSFAVTVYPSRAQFPVKQNDLIAWSGNSGSSGGPHLHFEVRETASEKPLNPLLYDLEAEDNIRPVIEKIVIYPLSRYSTVDNNPQSVSFQTSGSGGKYKIIADKPVTAHGETGIGIKCWDSFSRSNNKCGIYSIELLLDSVTRYCFTAKEFSFDESRYIDSHIDYSLRVEKNEYIHKTFVQPDNRLSMYDNLVNRGILTFDDDKDHLITIRVSDAASNISEVSFKIRSTSVNPVAVKQEEYSRMFTYDKAADFTAEGIRIHFPSNAFYDTLYFKYDIRSSDGIYLSPVHSLHNEFVAVHNPFRISVRPDTIIPGRERGMCLAHIDHNGKPSYSGGTFRYGYVSADVRLLGDYAVTTDTVSPVITPGFSHKANLSGQKSITLKINDNFSGIASYEAFIDDKWALFEYDPKNSLLIYRPDKTRISINSRHTLIVRATDNCGNVKEVSTEFTW